MAANVSTSNQGFSHRRIVDAALTHSIRVARWLC